MAFTAPYGELLRGIGSASVDGLSGSTRRFLVPGVTAVQALANTDLLTAAPFGSPHPESGPGDVLLAARYSISGGPTVQMPSGVAENGWYVDVEYEKGGVNFDFPPTQRTKDNALFREVTIDSETIFIPMITRRVESMAKNDPLDTEIKTYRYRVENQPLLISTLALRITFNLPESQWGITPINAIKNQINHVHTMGGGQWLFLGGNATSVQREGWFAVTLRWKGEDGTPPMSTDVAGHPDWILLPPEIVADIPARAPFQTYTRVDVTAPGLPAPGFDQTSLIKAEVRARAQYEPDPTGYQTLPGFGTKWTI